MNNIDKFILELKNLDFYTYFRQTGYMTSGQAGDAVELVEAKIEELIKRYGL